MPRSPGHVFYDRLQQVLISAAFDGFVEDLCASHYAAVRGRPSLPPGRYFRMLLIGYFEGIDSERGLEWRCADSLSLHEFLRAHRADQGDTASLPGTLEAAAEQLAALDALPTQEAPAELIADKGYHSRETLKSLADGPWKTRVSERRIDGVLRWHGDHAARRAVYNNRARLRSSVARGVFRLRAEWLERSFALILDRGGMRRTWLRGRENIHKRYLIHVAGYNNRG